VLTTYEKFTPHTAAATEPNAKSVTINITSEYYNAWGKYFERELERIEAKGNITYDDGSKTATIIITNTQQGTNYIYLCVYETRISAQVE